MRTYKLRRPSDGPSKVPGSICDSMFEKRSLQGMSEEGNQQPRIFFSNANQTITVEPLLSDNLLSRPLVIL